MEFRERLKQVMQEQGITRYRLSELSGIAPSTINNFFSGTSPSVNTVTQLCDGLGLTLSQFFFDRETETLYPLTKDQIILIEKWGKLSKEQQKALSVILDSINYSAKDRQKHARKLVQSCKNSPKITNFGFLIDTI